MVERGTLVRLQAADVPRVVEVFADAFRDYPVMRYVLGDEDGYARRLGTLIRFFVSARSLRGEPLLGMVVNDGLAAAATVSFPGSGDAPAELNGIRDATWRELGADARARYEACGEVWKTFTAPEPHIHLNMIGVRAGARGQGLAGRLLHRVHRMSLETPGSRGVSLTTEDPGNVALYRRAGYAVTGHARVGPELETWGFFRETPPGSG